MFLKKTCLPGRAVPYRKSQPLWKSWDLIIFANIEYISECLGIYVL